VKEEMTDQTRMIIFVALLVVILGLWSHFFQPPPPKPGEGKGAPAAAGSNPGSNPGSNSGSSAGTGTGAHSGTASDGAGSSGASAMHAAEAASSIPVVQASSEKITTVESALYSVEFSNKGAVVRSWQLKQYLTDDKPPRPLDLVNAQVAQQLGWPFSLVLADSHLRDEANSALYDVQPPPTGGAVNAPVDITFHWSDGHLDVTKKFSFATDYQLSLEASATLDGKALPVAIAWRGGFGDRAVYKAAQLVNVFYKSNGKLTLLNYKKLGVSGNQGSPAEVAGPLEFTGVQDQFFTATFIPEDSTNLTLGDWMQTANLSSGSEPEVALAAGTADAGPLRLRAYVGPKDLGQLGKVHPSLEELVNFGWTGIIAKPMLFILQWIHKYIHNWGWALIVFTLALTMILFPIRIWTFRSTRKMQIVGPEIKAIQDRYKKYSLNDPRKRKMNEEVMAVYQREGVNPVGSCLPMLVQIPFLWAFYRMLAGAIELRHAPWIGWIHDLSAKDPYYIVPILMVITSYLMTRMTPTPATVDPAQQRMMLLMPIFMGFIFFNLSSGLNLYYFTSNLVGVGQQWYLNRAQPLPSRSKFKKKKNE
jgi:YidC/Oxa1 family membrane protein insertase